MASSSLKAMRNYRELPQIMGKRILGIAFLARAPFAMIPLGAMTAFTASTSNVAIGGLVTAIISISTAIAAPLIGRAADLWGQRPVLFILAPINAVGLLGLFLCSLRPEAPWYLWIFCIITGASIIPVGSFTRARWVARVRAPYQLSAAFSYESMADELVFVLGPALVGIAASAAEPSAPLILAFALVVLVCIPFAFTSPTKMELSKEGETETQGQVPPQKTPSIGHVLWRVLPSIIILICVGTYFGTVQAGTTVRAEMLGDPGKAGLVYAVMGIGSAFTALLVVMVPEKIRLSIRILICSIGMAIFLALVNAQGSLLSTAITLGLAGVWVGPTLVTAFTITEKLAPKGGVSVALTSMQSSVTIGVSLGAAVGGLLARSYGESGAYLFAISVCSIIFIAALALQSHSFRKVSATI